MAYSGIVAELQLGDKGLTGTKSLAKTDPGQLLQALNVSYADGTISKEGGAIKYNSSNAYTGGLRVLGGWDWWPTINDQFQYIILDNGQTLRDAGDGSFSTAGGTSVSPPSTVPVFIECGAETAASQRKLYLIDGVNPPIVYTGTTALGVFGPSSPPADWAGTVQPVSMCVHENRLWGAVGHRVYYSLTTDHEDFTSAGAGSIGVYSGVGERIIQIMSWKSLLLIWKYPRGIFAIDTSSTTSSNWRVTRINESIGGISPMGACQIDDDILFVDAGFNIQLLSGIQEYGTLGNKNLSQFSELAPFIRDNLSFSQLPYTRTLYYPAKRECHIACAQIGSNVNNARLVVDFNNPQLPRFRYSTRDTCQSLWLRKNTNGTQRLVSGDDHGYVWLMDQDACSKDSAGYVGSFQTAYTDFAYLDPSLSTKRKLGQFLEVVGRPEGDWDLLAAILWDGKIVQTVSFDLNPVGVPLGSFVLGTDTLGDGGSLVNKRKRIVGSGQRFSVIFYNSGAGETFNLSRAFLSFKVGDERTIVP